MRENQHTADGKEPFVDLHSARFYGAKSEAIDSQEVIASENFGDYTWQILSVTHGGKDNATTDEYQVVVDKHERDVLNSDDGASAYLLNVAFIGEVHGDITARSATPLGADQSNTSLVATDDDGREWMFKVFRKLEEGLNPDVELLSEIDDCPFVAGVRGYVTRDGRTLAMMQQLIDGGKDGFVLACDAGAADDFASEAQALGAAIRTVHEALAATFGTKTVSGAEIASTLNEHLDELVGKAPQLAEYETRLRDLYAKVEGIESVPVQRIHGDLHLGQTLRTDHRWYLIDFEGEPARPLEQRRLPDCALRDVAGMVRSFGYARAVGEHSDEWERSAVNALLDGYGVNPASRDQAAPQHDESDHALLLAAYIADKAAYEVVYEANNRPDWVEIPLAAIETIS
nr:phosphotransferase [Corynebacterium aquatimens]